MTRIYYINADPPDLTASLRLDDDPWAPTIIQGIGIGHIEFPVSIDEHGHGATLRCEHDGYQPLERRVLLGTDLNEPDAAHLRWDDGTPADVAMTPVASPALPRLVTSGQFFALETGERWTAIQCSDFHALGRYMNGEDIAPVLAQRRDIGFSLLRVWIRYRLAQYGIGDCTLADHPDLYDRVPAFLDLCASYGLYVELTAYTGREDYDPNHWQRLCGASVQARTLPLLELVNENDQAGNRINTNDFLWDRALLCSHGSNGSEARPVEPFWDYATFHTNGASEWQRKNGHNAMEIWDGPTLTNEATRCPDQDANPTHFYDAAAGAALLCAGSCFHSVHGKSSELFAGVELDCAVAHVSGARSVPLGCQPYPYRHRTDLEGPFSLRTYQRGTEPVCIVRIRP